MMRKVIIIGAFLAGLLGLFMSLCGGGFFVMMTFESIKNIVRSGRQDQGALVLLVIPAAFTVCGAALFWACFKFIRRRYDRPQERNGKR